MCLWWGGGVRADKLGKEEGVDEDNLAEWSKALA